MTEPERRTGAVPDITIDEFLRARLEEDEQIARSALPGPWLRGTEREHLVDHVLYGQSTSWSGHLGQVANFEVAHSGAANLEHIARHDPARVLREVEAKRAIVDRLHHTQEVGLRNTPEPEEYTSCVCGWEQVVERGDYEGPYERHLADLGVNEIVAEAVLRLLALPYADHDEYRAEEWAP